ncbi:CPBP family intramembrane glutamic endopeptidase [Streptomyces sp. NPDC006186]|uniref:CPBP family intramembrane glutamic endopeptidase n=1 Tax=Streptomyces sp. NPDC006186 TaxID=3155248 RepID=UPI00339EEA5C
MTTQFHGPPPGPWPAPPPFFPYPEAPRPVGELPYHRMALATGRHAWWRPLVGTLVLTVGVFLLMLVLVVVSEVAGAALDRPLDADDMRSWGGVGDTAISLLTIAVALPPVLLTARWIQARPAGTVSSVVGRLRWGWLARCLVPAAVLIVLSFGVSMLLPDSGDTQSTEWVGLPTFLAGLAVVCAGVPFQAAAEEYVFRGWLLQAAGAWVRWPWIAAVPQALLFAAAHGWGTVWGFADLVVFGVVCAMLAVRTGGLEAGIALHVLNNLMSMGVAAGIAGALESDETAADLDWVGAAVDIPMILLYAAAVLWLARRRRLRTISPPAPETPAPVAPTGARAAYGMPGPGVPGYGVPGYGAPAHAGRGAPPYGPPYAGPGPVPHGGTAPPPAPAGPPPAPAAPPPSAPPSAPPTEPSTAAESAGTGGTGTAERADETGNGGPAAG